jgi:hypothetical protein
MFLFSMFLYKLLLAFRIGVANSSELLLHGFRPLFFVGIFVGMVFDRQLPERLVPEAYLHPDVRLQTVVRVIFRQVEFFTRLQ